MLNAFGRTIIFIQQGSKCQNTSFRFEKADVNTKYTQLYCNGVWTFRNEIKRLNETSSYVTSIQVWNFQCIIGHFLTLSSKRIKFHNLAKPSLPRAHIVSIFFTPFSFSLLCALNWNFLFCMIYSPFLADSIEPTWRASISQTTLIF